MAGMYSAEWSIDSVESWEQIRGVPLLNKLVLILEERHVKKTIGAQVIPLDDALKVLKICENPSLLPCLCREIIGKEDYCCINFGFIPELYKKANPNSYMEEISLNKAERLLSDWDKKGLYHLISWNNIPYVTTLCNCTAPYCTVYKMRFTSGLRNIMLKGEYVAKVNQRLCVGCKECLSRCPFGAISFNVDDETIFIDINRCFGCGLCVNGCKNTAIALIDRGLTPAKNRW
ncbi:MAG: 4Fe-4S dicluster domain-containing protein [Methanophagales archaeon ANME-1-THS]|nr:MAG: 4Fe-4S dicluster domain-containing protein [Methanophagales archaeon ANME-1-THS]